MTLQQRWIKLAARIDALTPRERVLSLAALLGTLGFVAWMAVLGPATRKQEALRKQLVEQRATLSTVEGEIAEKIAASQRDPDAVQRKRLDAVTADTARLAESLRAMQKGLVPPERIAPLLESILRTNGRLKLVSMQTLPVGSLSELAQHSAPVPVASAVSAAADDAARPAAKGPAKAPELLYRHGVELTVRGNYLDMVDYMAALEALPTQLFWGKAQLDVEQYPNVRLTLTLYTLSLDAKWMKL